MFSDQQEIDLGDAMAETVALHFNVTQDDDLTAHLRDVGNRLVRYLPPSKLNFRFYLLDMPEVNAFSIAGGRVYVSRKIVAFARNDDELAGVLAHELGHIVTHQIAIDMTRAFRDGLGVTQVGSREDIFRKYHQLLENTSRLKRRRSNSEDKYQIAADQVSVYTLARAGFAPGAMPEFWDRFAELHGKSGSWFSDWFGTTTPEQHRLREMVKNMAALPAGCADKQPANADEQFAIWRESVVEHEDKRSEALPGLISKRRLSQRLRPQIADLRFSPDGRYILAQDDGGVHIVSTKPFEAVFYIPAADVREAKFSPDSKSVVLLTSNLRVERWNIAERKRQDVRELTLRHTCVQSEISPDGTTLGCLGQDLSLQVVDVSNNTVVFRRDHFYVPTFIDLLNMLLRSSVRGKEVDDELAPPQLVNLEFSPDCHYLLASALALNSQPIAFDLEKRTEAKLPGSIKAAMRIKYAFVGSDKILGIDPYKPQKSPLLKFPSGEKIAEIPLGNAATTVRGATRGDYLIVGPLTDYPLGIVDLSTAKIAVAIKQPAVDEYDNVFVLERFDGELALHTKESNKPIATLRLPESDLGRLTVAAVSPDLNYLVVSTRSRSAVWDLPRDARVFQARAIHGAGFYGSSVYADFPKFETKARSIANLSIDRGTVTEVREIKDPTTVQREDYLLTRTVSKQGGHNPEVDIKVEDVRSGQPLWSWHFRSMPSIDFSPQNATLVLSWPATAPGIQDEIKKFPAQKTPDKDDIFCEAADANLGALSASFTFKTNHGSLRLLTAQASREWAVVEANGNQILAFSMPGGEDRGHFFGTAPVLSSTGKLVVSSGRQEIAAYDLSASQEPQQYVFASPVVFKSFSGDGKRLFVFTSDQTVYVLDLTVMKSAAPISASVN